MSPALLLLLPLRVHPALRPPHGLASMATLVEVQFSRPVSRSPLRMLDPHILVRHGSILMTCLIDPFANSLVRVVSSAFLRISRDHHLCWRRHQAQCHSYHSDFRHCSDRQLDQWPDCVSKSDLICSALRSECGVDCRRLLGG